MELIFFISIFGTLYSYLIYPLILSLIPKRQEIAAVATNPLPSVDLIITVHNEQARIEKKLQNSLQIDYPKDKLNIIIASDCSTDDTHEIVNRYSDQGIKLVIADQHNGKEYAQKCAIDASSSDIIVFSDVATQIPTEAISAITAYFSNDHIGAVSSEDRFITDGGKIAGEGAYVKYEMWLRKLESQRAGLIGLSGSFFAVRRSVCDNWDTQSPSDFNTALQCATHDKIAVSSPKVLGYYRDLSDPKKEYNRKVRTVLRGITALFRHTESLNLSKYGLFSFQVWSHKVFRWLVPFFLITSLISSIALCGDHWIYSLATLGQFILYLIAIAGYVSERAKENSLVRIVFFFVQVNIAIAHAWFKYLKGTRMTVWTPSLR